MSSDVTHVSLKTVIFREHHSSEVAPAAGCGSHGLKGQRANEMASPRARATGSPGLMSSSGVLSNSRLRLYGLGLLSVSLLAVTLVSRECSQLDLPLLGHHHCTQGPLPRNFPPVSSWLPSPRPRCQSAGPQCVPLGMMWWLSV